MGSSSSPGSASTELLTLLNNLTNKEEIDLLDKLAKYDVNQVNTEKCSVVRTNNSTSGQITDIF